MLETAKSSRWILLELGMIYSFVQIYIWRWQYTRPKTVWLILLLLLASLLSHRDTLRDLGFRIDSDRGGVPTGRFVVRVNGTWVEVKESVGAARLSQ